MNEVIRVNYTYILSDLCDLLKKNFWSIVLFSWVSRLVFLPFYSGKKNKRKNNGSL